MKEDQRIILTKRLLCEALLKLLNTKEIDKIKVTELCETAGINRATFYRHYNQPRDVLSELKTIVSAELRSLLSAGSVADNPRRSLTVICRYCAERAELMKTLLESGGDDELTHMLNDLYRENLSRIEHFEQQYNIGSEQFMLASYYYAGGIYFILRKWLSSENRLPPEEIANIIYLVISGSISESLKDL